MWMVTINLVSCKVLKSLTIPLLSLTCSSYSTPIPHTSFCYKGSCVFSYHLWIIMTSSPPLLLKILPMPATRSSVISALSLCRVMSCDQLLNSYHRLKDVPFISSWKFSPQLCYHPCQVPLESGQPHTSNFGQGYNSPRMEFSDLIGSHICFMIHSVSTTLTHCWSSIHKSLMFGTAKQRHAAMGHRIATWQPSSSWSQTHSSICTIVSRQSPPSTYCIVS